MSQMKMFSPVVGIALAAALAGTGCLAQGPDDEAAAGPEEATVATTGDSAAAPEHAGEARQALLFPTNAFDFAGGFTFPFFAGLTGCGCACALPYFAGIEAPCF